MSREYQSDPTGGGVAGPHRAAGGAPAPGAAAGPYRAAGSAAAPRSLSNSATRRLMVDTGLSRDGIGWNSPNSCVEVGPNRLLGLQDAGVSTVRRLRAESVRNPRRGFVAVPVPTPEALRSPRSRAPVQRACPSVGPRAPRGDRLRSAGAWPRQSSRPAESGAPAYPSRPARAAAGGRPGERRPTGSG